MSEKSLRSGVRPSDDKIVFDRLARSEGLLVRSGAAPIRLEVHADVVSEFEMVSDRIRIGFDTASPGYVRAEDYQTGREFTGIITDGTGTGEISVRILPATLFLFQFETTLFHEPLEMLLRSIGLSTILKHRQ